MTKYRIISKTNYFMKGTTITYYYVQVRGLFLWFTVTKFYYGGYANRKFNSVEECEEYIREQVFKSKKKVIKEL